MLSVPQSAAADLLAQLLGMGFDEELARLASSSHTSLQEAVTWAMKAQDEGIDACFTSGGSLGVKRGRGVASQVQDGAMAGAAAPLPAPAEPLAEADAFGTAQKRRRGEGSVLPARAGAGSVESSGGCTVGGGRGVVHGHSTPDPAAVQQLVECLGLEAPVARLGLSHTGGSDVEAAVEWIFAHPGEVASLVGGGSEATGEGLEMDVVRPSAQMQAAGQAHAATDPSLLHAVPPSMPGSAQYVAVPDSGDTDTAADGAATAGPARFVPVHSKSLREVCSGAPVGAVCEISVRQSLVELNQKKGAESYSGPLPLLPTMRITARSPGQSSDVCLSLCAVQVAHFLLQCCPHPELQLPSAAMNPKRVAQGSGVVAALGTSIGSMKRRAEFMCEFLAVRVDGGSCLFSLRGLRRASLLVPSLEEAVGLDADRIQPALTDADGDEWFEVHASRLGALSAGAASHSCASAPNPTEQGAASAAEGHAEAAGGDDDADEEAKAAELGMDVPSFRLMKQLQEAEEDDDGGAAMEASRALPAKGAVPVGQLRDVKAFDEVSKEADESHATAAAARKAFGRRASGTVTMLGGVSASQRAALARAGTKSTPAAPGKDAVLPSTSSDPLGSLKMHVSDQLHTSHGARSGAAREPVRVRRGNKPGVRRTGASILARGRRGRGGRGRGRTVAGFGGGMWGSLPSRHTPSLVSAPPAPALAAGAGQAAAGPAAAGASASAARVARAPPASASVGAGKGLVAEDGGAREFKAGWSNGRHESGRGTRASPWG